MGYLIPHPRQYCSGVVLRGARRQGAVPRWLSSARMSQCWQFTHHSTAEPSGGSHSG